MHANRVLGPTIAIARGTIDTDDRGEVCGALVKTRSTSGTLASVSHRCPWNQPIPCVTTSFPVRPAHSLHDQVMAHVIGPSRDGPADARRRASLPSPGVSGVSSSRPDRMLLHIWQLPTTATPRLAEPERKATLKGRPLRLVETGVPKRLKANGISVARVKPERALVRPLEEEAVSLALKFRALAPMREHRPHPDGLRGHRQAHDGRSYCWLRMPLH